MPRSSSSDRISAFRPRRRDEQVALLRPYVGENACRWQLAHRLASSCLGIDQPWPGRCGHAAGRSPCWDANVALCSRSSSMSISPAGGRSRLLITGHDAPWRSRSSTDGCPAGGSQVLDAVPLFVGELGLALEVARDRSRRGPGSDGLSPSVLTTVCGQPSPRSAASRRPSVCFLGAPVGRAQ